MQHKVMQIIVKKKLSKGKAESLILDMLACLNVKCPWSGIFSDVGSGKEIIYLIFFKKMDQSLNLTYSHSEHE